MKRIFEGYQLMPKNGIRFSFGGLNDTIRHFTSTLAVTSHKSTLVSCLRRKHISVLHVLALGPCPRDQLNAKDVDMEQAVLLCYVTTKVLVKCRITGLHYAIANSIFFRLKRGL